MDFVLADVAERDVDFALMREVAISEGVRSLLLKRVGESGELVEVFHSLVQEESEGKYGESDVVFVFRDLTGALFAILVEDKVAADAQPRQRERYDVRGEALMKEKNLARKPHVIITAPQKYLDGGKANEYEIQISHEALIPLCVDDLDRKVFENSCSAKQGYVPNKNDSVTDYWNNLIDYLSKDEKYSALKFNRRKKDRGSRAFWPEFDTNVPGLKVYFKSDQNVIDLEFANMKAKRESVKALLDGLRIDSTPYHFDYARSGEALFLRKQLPADKKVNFHKPFLDQIDDLRYCMDEVVKLVELAYVIGDSGRVTKFPIE